ncbi:MAG: sterol desaturase family protein [Pseudomonadota bacterium]
MTDVLRPAQTPREKLPRANRNHTIRDLIVFDKTRKMFYYWTPFCLLTGGLAVAHASAWWVLLGGAIFGVAVYTLVEYLMHRFVYHWEPESKFWRIVTADMGRSHMGHHRNPAKYGGGINGNQPPIVLIAAVLALGAYFTPFPTAFGLMAVTTGAINYVGQEFVHFGTHHLPMNNRMMRAMKRHHMLHHYQDEHSNYGLFWPVWDWILGTSFDGKTKRRRGA